MSKILSNIPDDNFDECMLAMDENTERELSSRATENPYSELIPYFKEMISHMNGYCIEKDFVEIKNFFQNQVAKFKEIANRNFPITHSIIRKTSDDFIINSNSKEKKISRYKTFLNRFTLSLFVWR